MKGKKMRRKGEYKRTWIFLSPARHLFFITCQTSIFYHLPNIYCLCVGHRGQGSVYGRCLSNEQSAVSKILAVLVGHEDMKMMLTCVDMVSRVVTPRATLAGTALGSSQKFTLSRSFVCSNLGFDCIYVYMIIWQSIWSKPASWTYSGITLDIKVFSLWRTS